MKNCIKCGEEKPLDEYYKHPRMSDGHLNTCKSCKRAYQSKREKELRENDPDWVEKERRRSREKYYRLNYNERYDSHTGDENSNYHKRYPEKRKAVLASQRIPCPSNCERHHWSYRQEHHKDVIIIDSKTHAFVHRYLEYDQDKMMFRTKSGRLLNTKYKHRVYLINLIADANDDELQLMLEDAA